MKVVGKKAEGGRTPYSRTLKVEWILLISGYSCWAVVNMERLCHTFGCHSLSDKERRKS